MPEAQFLFMGGEPAEIEALRGARGRAGAARRCVFAGKRPPAELPALPGPGRRRWSRRAATGVNTPFKVYTYLASGRPLVATRIATHTQLLDDTLAFLVEPTADGARRAASAPALADPAEAARAAPRAAAR